MAHMGVLQVLEEEDIPLDLIVGTSIGALVGAAYASGTRARIMERRAKDFFESAVFRESALKSAKEMQASKDLTLTQKIQAFFKNRYMLAQAMFRAGMLQSENFQAMIDYFIPDVEIQDLPIPYRAIATDLITGQPVVLSRGPLRKAVMASCAVPAAVAPTCLDQWLLSDGGVVHMVPNRVARHEGAEFVVAVSVNREIYSREKFTSAVDIYVRAAEIMSFHFERLMLEDADVVIRPKVGDIHWTDFDLTDELVGAGAGATREMLPDILKGLPLAVRLLHALKGKR